MSAITMNKVQTRRNNSVDTLLPLEVKTFSLEDTVKVHLDEHVSGISSPLYLVIAAENKVFVSKEDTLKVIWEIPADNPTSISLSDDSCLLLVTENGGVLNLYHIPTKQNVWCHVFEKENLLSLTQTYIATDHLGFLKIYILTKEQIVFEISNISVSTLYEALDVGNLKEVFDAAVLEEIDFATLFPNHKVVHSFQTFCSPQSLGLITQQCSWTKDTEYYDPEDLINGVLEMSYFNIGVANEWNLNEKPMFLHHDLSDYGLIIKACNTRDGRYIVFLNEKHVLNIMCPFTQLVLKSHYIEEEEGCIKNFVLNETVDPYSFHVIEQKIGLLIQTSSFGNTNYVLEIFKFPSFQLIHRISLSEYVQLIDCKPNQDYWYVLDSKPVGDSGEKQACSLNVKAIFESLPEARLANLVNKRKFADAQKLAQESNLNTEVIYKAKIKSILDNLSVKKSKVASEADFDQVWVELEDSFKHIKDLKFVQSCVLISLSEKNHMEKLLLCIKNWVIHNSSGNDIKSIMSQVNQILDKLLTHEILCDEFDLCISLNDFLSKDLLMYMIMELKAGNLGTSFSIWERHKDELLLSLDFGSLTEIISSIPNSMSSKVLIPFLCNEFLPPLFKANPDTIETVATWLIQRVYLMECYEKDLWPENGRKLITTFLQIIHDLEEKSKTGEIGFSRNFSFASILGKFIDPQSSVYCLSKFAKDLTWLVFLKSEFNCKISLTECQEESKMNVLFALLDRVDLKYIQDMLDKFARPYSFENQLDLEDCLEQYIKYALQNSCFTWWYWDEDPWEDRLVAITEAIRCTDKWVNAALLVASRATVPWSQPIRDMVKKGMACDHQKKTYFENEYKLVGLKEVLLKYDMKTFPINDRVELVDVLVKYIFKQNKNGALEDAKKVLDSLPEQQAINTDVYFSFLQYAILHDKIDIVSEVFPTLSEDTAVKCAVRLLKCVRMGLEDRFFIESKKDCIQSIIHAGLFFLEYLKSVNKLIDEDLVVPFRNLLKLQEEFGIYMTFSEITSRSNCEKVINSIINDFLENKSIQKASNTYLKNRKTTSSIVSQLYRLGSILLFEREEVMGFMITSCLTKQRYDLVLKLCQELTAYPSTNASETLMEVARHFYQNFKNIKDANFNVMINTICHLTNVAVTYCQEDSVMKYLDIVQLSSYVSSLRDITGQHSLSITPEFTSNAYHKWKFYPIYQDEGFQLDFELVTNYISEIFLNNMKKSGNTVADCDDESNFSKMVIHMKDKGQGLLALRTIFMHYCTNNYEPSLKLPVISLVHQICNETAQKSLNHRKKDHYFTFNLLAILPKTSQLSLLEKLLKWCSSDLNRLAIVGKIGMEVGSSLQNCNVFTMYENIHKKASFLAKQGSKSDLNITVILNSSNQEAISAVVKGVVLSPSITIPVIYECCAAFQLPTDPLLILHLKSILLESEKYLNLEDYDKRIVATLQNAENVISYITDEALLYEQFQHWLKKISSYSYEVFLFIVEQLINFSSNIQTFDSGTAEKKIALLKFLQVYKRIAPLDEVEISRWQTLHPMDMPPLISKKRLPLHCFLNDDPHKIINPELTANTLPVWLKIAPVLKIDMEDLVFIAVKNTVMSYLEKQSSQHIQLNPDLRFASVINDMIERICRSKPEAAACCAAWVTDKMPPGGNKVCFANMTVKFSKIWCEQGTTSQNVVDFHNKIIHQNNSCAIEKVLHCHKLTSQKILSLIQSPVQLISYLIETFSLNIGESLKACKAASEIGNIMKLDTTDIFMSFILKWIKISSYSAANFDETFSEDLNVSNDGEDADTENIFRVINLLLSLPISEFPDFYCTLKMKFQELPLIQRSKLLLCLVAAFDAETVSSQLEVDARLLKDNIVSLMCSVELEKLNLPYSLSMFANCNKSELIQRILSNSNNSKIVTFCIRLCLEFNIWETSIWEVILKRMAMKPMEYAIQDILQSAQGYLKHLWHSEAFVAAWKCVINSIMQIRSSDIHVLISKLYKAVVRCPCATSLDVLYMTRELKYIVQTFDQRIISELDSIKDITSFILYLSEIMNNHPSTEENQDK